MKKTDISLQVGSQVGWRTINSEAGTALFELSQDMMCIGDFDGYLVLVNPAWTDTLGWAPQELYATPYLEFVHPDDQKSTIEKAKALYRGEQVVQFDNRYRHKNGTYRWLQWSASPSPHDKRIYATVRDITDEKRRSLHNAEVEKITGVGSWEIDLTSGSLYWSDVTHLIHETDPSTFRPQLADGLSFYPPEAQPEIQLWVDRLMTTGESYDLELPFVTSKGNRIWVRATARAELKDGKVVRAFGTFQNITAEKEAQMRREAEELRLSQAEMLLRDVLETIPDAVAAYDSDGKLFVFNEAYRQFYAISAPAIEVGARFEDILRYGLARGQYLDAGSTPREWDAWLKKRVENHYQSVNKGVQQLGDGRWIQIHEKRSETGICVGVRTDITTIKEAETLIKRQNLEDALTGLANRNSLRGEIALCFQTRENELNQQRQLITDQDQLLANKEHLPDLQPNALNPSVRQTSVIRADTRHHRFSVMLIDLDRFKAVNDTFGHAMGDALLKEVAERMRVSVRKTDIVARLGGDEFAILYRIAPNQREDSITIASRLVEKISAPYEIDGRIINIGASIGIAIAPDHGESVDELIRNADIALYNVKENGRNGFRIFDEELDSINRKMRDLENDLRLALERQEFQLVYHPIVDLKTQKVVSVEALLRWHHATRGLVSPDIFIPLAEETGLMALIGDWVIHRACEEALNMPQDISVAVNISAVQMRNRSLSDVVEAALWKTRLRPDRFEIEVTETVLLDVNKLFLPDLQNLKSLGIKIALDDFGTGYSSLSYLRLFDFDKLKIDKTFISDIGKSHEATTIVKAMIGLANNLGVTCTAEGIENEEQASLLTLANCAEGQGYLYTPPMGLKSLLHWLEERKQVQALEDKVFKI